MHDKIGRAVDLPREVGGIPLDELGATGFGLAAAVDVGAKAIGLDLRSAKVAVQGFGAVGKHAARFLAKMGCVLVAASDSHGTVSSLGGLDVAGLIALKEAGQSVTDFPQGTKAGIDAIIDIPCDIWIPAARPDVLSKDNIGRLKAKIVVEGANIPCTTGAEAILESRGVLILPDFVVNAGGVICAVTEFHGGNETTAFVSIDEKIRRNTTLLINKARGEGISMREAAMGLATERIWNAQRTRRWK
jgi:glutamate dehydrogenase (NAD(P)+)